MTGLDLSSWLVDSHLLSVRLHGLCPVHVEGGMDRERWVEEENKREGEGVGRGGTHGEGKRERKGDLFPLLLRPPILSD